MVQTAEEDLISAGFEHNKPCLTWAQADAYLQDLRNQGRTPETIQTYRRNLMLLFEGLPESGQLDRGTLARWRDAMLERGYTPQTVNVRLAAANGFLDYIGLRDYQLSKRLKPAEDAVQPELTRNEYLRLLSAARVLGKERTYLLVKAFAVLGLSLHDLPNLTAEAVENGMLMTSANHSHQLIRIPNCLQVELRNYLQREGIQSGPVFRTRSGKTVNRTAATGCIQQLSKDARVAPEKCNPRCLRKLCQSTRESVEQSISLLVEQALDRLLEQEQITAGWEGSGYEK
ncbi:tyrosine-type recombinase/integrase [Dysosmobacter sp.]|uniref:tyrosine-type recombinase/integrase n=1 Tax=Dysosmobacter sp. TaxID=2591382 RepID=UPI003AEF39B3